jgi:hypothetical protein
LPGKAVVGDAGIDFTQAGDGRLWEITRNDIAELRAA